MNLKKAINKYFIRVLIAMFIFNFLVGCSSKNKQFQTATMSDSQSVKNSSSSKNIVNSSQNSISGSSQIIKSQTSTSKQGTGISSSSIPNKEKGLFFGIPLEDYSAPNDGISYDTTPLVLNKPMNIITRSGDKLYDGDKEFRFISANAPTLLDCTPWEQEDLIKTVAQMGGQVVRTYTFSVNTSTQGTSPTTANFILGKGIYNEAALIRMDNLLALCNTYGIKIIIPFIDPYEYNGGIPAFNDLFGKKDISSRSQLVNSATFYSDINIKKEFFNFVKFVLNRKNTITGKYYKDDPAILAWESGNEMPYYNETESYYDGWMKELGLVIKSIDNKHLIIDGSAFGIRSAAENDPNIDIVSIHFYPTTTTNKFDVDCKNFRNFFKNKKASIVGEFGFVPTSDVKSLYDEVINNGTSGVLFWSLRQHSEVGSFIHHRENAQFSAYHWPGFSTGDSYYETEFLRLTYLKAFEIQNKKPKLIETPKTPKIITPIRNPQVSITWRGSTGAYGYDIQRANSLNGSINGPWTTIGVNVIDDFISTTILFADTSKGLIAGSNYYYRIRAKSAGGFSDWSSPVLATVLKDS